MALLRRALIKQSTAKSQGSVRVLGMAWISLLSCLQAAPATQPAPVAEAIPQAFLGEWNANLEACGSLRSESRLVLEPHRASFFSSQAEVVQLQVENPRRIQLTLRFGPRPETGHGQGSGATTDSNLQRRYLLSSDLQRLQDISQGEQGMIRWRCPSGHR